MATVINTILIQGAVAAVFDLVTTTRFWTQWHPATIGVGGVTERPFQLGDQIRERAQIGAHTYEGIWTVIDHERPLRARLRAGSGRIHIGYTFAQAGEEVRLTRTLEFFAEDFRASVSDISKIEPLMDSQSEQALHKIKALVENILAQEYTLAIVER
jgi:hypothetical protein